MNLIVKIVFKGEGENVFRHGETDVRTFQLGLHIVLPKWISIAIVRGNVVGWG